MNLLIFRARLKKRTQNLLIFYAAAQSFGVTPAAACSALHAMPQ
ncbi:hypothetical protein [Bradyrhizobium sp. 930_D9_N1_4]